MTLIVTMRRITMKTFQRGWEAEACSLASWPPLSHFRWNSTIIILVIVISISSSSPLSMWSPPSSSSSSSLYYLAATLALQVKISSSTILSAHISAQITVQISAQISNLCSYRCSNLCSNPFSNLCSYSCSNLCSGSSQTKQISRPRSPLLNTRVSQKPPWPSFKGDDDDHHP